MARIERGTNTYGREPCRSTTRTTTACGRSTSSCPRPDTGSRSLRNDRRQGRRGQDHQQRDAGTPLGVDRHGRPRLEHRRGARARTRARERKTSRHEFVAQLGVLNVIAILIGAIGGFSFLLALAGFGHVPNVEPNIDLHRVRIAARDRASCSTGCSGSLRTRLGRRARCVRHRDRRASSWPCSSLGGCARSDHAALRHQLRERRATRFDIDATFYHDLEKIAAESSMVFQLPVRAVPRERARSRRWATTRTSPATCTPRTCGGATAGIKGRPEGDWQQNLSIYDPIATLGEIAAAGFDGVVIDRTGFADGADEFLEGAVEPYVGAPVLTEPGRPAAVPRPHRAARRGWIEPKLGPAAVGAGRADRARR